MFVCLLYRLIIIIIIIILYNNTLFHIYIQRKNYKNCRKLEKEVAERVSV